MKQLFQITGRFLLFFFSITGCKQELKINTQDFGFIDISDHISNKSVTSFCPTIRGYMWIGTKYGLNRYNGYEYNCHYHEEEDIKSLSNNHITCMYYDTQKREWIGTENGICRQFLQGIFKRYPIEGSAKHVLNIIESSSGEIIILTTAGLYKLNEEKEVFISMFNILAESLIFQACRRDCLDNIWIVMQNSIKCYYHINNSLSNVIQRDDIITCSYLHESRFLWFSSGMKTEIYDVVNNQFIPLPSTLTKRISGKISLKAIYKYDETSILLYAENHEMFLYNIETDILINQNDSHFPFKIPEKEISTIYIDETKNIWIGFEDDGFEVIRNYTGKFNDIPALSTRFNGLSVLFITEDCNKNLWLITDDNNTYIVNDKSNHIETWNIDKDIQGCLIDRRNNIWFVYHNTVTLHRYENNRLKFIRKYKFPSILTGAIAETEEGEIWLGCAGNPDIYMINDESGGYKLFELYKTDKFTQVSSILKLSEGIMLIALYDMGLALVYPDGSVSRIFQPEDISNSLFAPTTMSLDSKGNVFIGTSHTGLFTFDITSLRINRISDLSHVNISSVVEDDNGNIWMGSKNGLIKYDREKTNKITTFYTSDGIGGEQFNNNAYYKASNGMIYMGGIHGLTCFIYDEGKQKNETARAYVEYILLNNLPQYFPIYGLHINSKGYYELPLEYNSFGLSYMILDPVDYSSYRYAYMMEGYDKDWIYANTNRLASYTDLPSGYYQFLLRVYNNDYSQMITETTRKIYIKPPSYLHPVLLYGVYPIIVLLIIILIIYHYRYILHSRRLAEQAIFETEQEKKINQLNMRFFSNISHEFRTPLTMIKGPVDLLSQKYRYTDEQTESLFAFIQRNIDRMLRLISQQMDFEKMANHTLRLKVKQQDICEAIVEILKEFEFNIKNNGISLVKIGLDCSFITWLDYDKLEKILANLISNALKHTPSGGRIEVAFAVINQDEAKVLFSIEQAAAKYAKISVSDTGEGLPEDKKEEIFKRFYRLKRGENMTGTGIGLFYTKCLTEAHHGFIKAENGQNMGAVFTFLIPVDEQVYAEEELNKDTSPLFVTQQNSIQTIDQMKQSDQTNDDSKETILLVEDDIEVVCFLKILFTPYYNLKIRLLATKAMEELEEINPDLIISDIVMPGMDGIEFCRKIKENIVTSHIPVILLTARSTIHDKVEGLDCGADGYITKPFEPTYLLALVKTTLKNRDKMHSILSKATNTMELKGKMLSVNDKKIMNVLFELIEKELSNPELNISKIAEMMNMSRAKFYYKVKGLTGESPNNFFKTYKLNRALELLSEKKYSISEIADFTGFNTLSHFTNSFKKKFGKSPSSYMKTTEIDLSRPHSYFRKQT
jgi:signal transduction histidine kinase/DNA-binding response OmpR family regulator/ligand-binding sensor domain-containing protein